MAQREELRNILRALRQHEATTGRALTPGQLEEISRAGFATEAAGRFKSRELALRERALEEDIRFQQEGLEQAELTGKVGTGLQIGALGVQHFAGKRALESAAADRAMMLKIFGGGVPAGATPNITGTAGLKAAETAAGAPAAGASPFGVGLGIAAGAGIGSQFGAGKGKQLTTAAGAGIGAAIAGAGPVGIAIGVAAGLIGGDKVICGLMWANGDLPTNIYKLDQLYARTHVPAITQIGYRMWADPLVKLMRKSQFVYVLVRPLSKAWAYTMAGRMDKTLEVSKWHKFFGTILIKTMTPVCRGLTNLYMVGA